jgi:hypothetical protein
MLVSKSRILYSFRTFFFEKVVKIAFNISVCEQNVWPQTFLLDQFTAHFSMDSKSAFLNAHLSFVK